MLTLMTTSIILLVVLQVFWLYNSYEKALYDFHKDVDGIFRYTVRSLHDSALLHQIETLPRDSNLSDRSPFVLTQSMDSLEINSKARIQVSRNSSSHFNMFVASTSSGDSLKAMLRPLIGKLHDGKMKTGNFIIRIGPDSLRLDTIGKYFLKSLAGSGILLPFKINKINQFPEDDFPNTPQFKSKIRMRMDEAELVSPVVFNDTIMTAWVRTDPMNKYAATLTGTNLFILSNISPQILFSLFLTILTLVAFTVMYNNIKSQQRLMEIKNDFISNITHELKTPVTTVSVALEALRNFKGLENPQRTAEYLDIAQSELNRLTLITDKILTTAIFENKGVDFDPEPVDLAQTMDQVLHSMKLVFEKQKARVIFEKSGDSFIIAGGPIHLTNVIYNLLDNALKYSEGEPHISILLEEVDYRVVLKVADRGIGISKEFNKKIFEKFFRVPAGDVHNVKGYGLGLSYVESVIKSHKGIIEVESEFGKGTTFIIVIPKLGL